MLRISEEGKALYTPEQQAYILEYAAGYLVGWMAEHIGNLISPDVGDGFSPPEGLFPDEEAEEAEGKEPLAWKAHSEVCSVLDNAFLAVARQAGYKGETDDEVWKQAINATSGKYPAVAGEQ